MSVGSLETTEDGVPLQAQDGPREVDKKPVMVMSPATEGTFTWLSSRGDDLNPASGTGRGEGEQAFLEWDGTEDPWPETKEVELQFMEPIELHDGHVSWSEAWGFEDKWSLLVRMPATVTAPNGGGTGNCNLVDLGGYNLIEPADGDGTHDVDLDAAVPVPGEDGYWDVDERWSGTITPNPEAEGKFHLFDVQIEMSFCKNMDCGDAMRRWDLDAYKAEWISKRWRLVFSATKQTSGAGKIGGYLMIFRPGAT
jgi:hypothetical protein